MRMVHLSRNESCSRDITHICMQDYNKVGFRGCSHLAGSSERDRVTGIRVRITGGCENNKYEVAQQE